MQVNEIFHSIQGEGRYAGEPAFFIRLQGCPVRCEFCDTKKSWAAIQSPAMTAEEIVSAITDMQAKYPKIQRVVITGGEPFYAAKGHELRLLIDLLTFNCGFRVSIETSGSCQTSGEFWYFQGPIHVTFSPKYKAGEPGFLPIDFDLLRTGICGGRFWPTDFKFLVDGTEAAEARIVYFVENVLPKSIVEESNHMFFLQPVDFLFVPGSGDEDYRHEQAMANNQAVELAKRYGWQVSCQIHKYLGIA